MNGGDIQVGDVVYVAKPMPCCGDTSTMGYTFTVQVLKQYLTHCVACGAVKIEPAALDLDTGFGMLVCVLKKFKPLDELADRNTVMKAPA